LKTELRWTILPINYMWTDEETHDQRHFQVRAASTRDGSFTSSTESAMRALSIAPESKVLDAITFEPCDPRLALPD